MYETDDAAGERGCWTLGAENGRFPGDPVRLANHRWNPQENPLRSRRQSGGAHLVHEFLCTARVQIAAQ